MDVPVLLLAAVVAPLYGFIGIMLLSQLNIARGQGRIEERQNAHGRDINQAEEDIRTQAARTDDILSERNR